MHMVPATLLTAIVTIVALLLYFYTGLRVGGARGKYKIDAPAMTGNPDFERVVRVQMNTLEQLVVFLPLLWLATTYSPWIGWLPPALGAVWIVGRFLYMTGYIAAANKRSMGFLISLLATAGLLILSIWGVVNAWMAVNA